ncbi:MAG TPA: hypothetical protein VFE47_30695 [Tepidisphaeraceae bacterium]|jgi:hypothetical protein|nr:hypothetical protein [Tepidisphaeraceae bacterium]
MSEPSIYVCVVNTPEGRKQYVTLLSPDLVSGRGLISEAIIGAFEIKDGEILPDSYHPMHDHKILSANGFFQLPPGLQGHLMRELQSRMSAG